MENQLAQLQQIQQQIQMVATQRVQLEAQTKELERAIEILDKSASDVSVYKSVGSILVKAESKDKTKVEIEDQKETMSVRVKTLERQEAHLRERFNTLQQQLSKALKLSPTQKAKPDKDDDAEEEH